MMLFGRDLAIDLGTTSVLLAAKSKGVLLREPSVVAFLKSVWLHSACSDVLPAISLQSSP